MYKQTHGCQNVLNVMDKYLYYVIQINQKKTLRIYISIIKNWQNLKRKKINTQETPKLKNSS